MDTSSFQSLSGEVVKTSELKHNNMQPFIGMKETLQYKENFEDNSQKLQLFTGRGSEIQRKTEIPGCREPWRDQRALTVRSYT